MIVRVPIYLDVDVAKVDDATVGLLAARFARVIATRQYQDGFLEADVLNVGSSPVRYPAPRPRHEGEQVLDTP